MWTAVTLVLLTFWCVEAVNVALNRPAVQNDRNDNSNWANDGNYDQDYYHSSCSHTGASTNTWWTVDLIRPYIIHTIRILNRDSFQYRLQNFKIYVSESNPLPLPASENSFVGELCVHYPGTLPSTGLQQINCNNPIKGRYVYVWKTGHQELTMCEFEVIVDKEESREAVSTVLHSGQRSTLTPVRWKQLKQISSTSCMAVCMAGSEQGITHYQMNRHSGLCECFQVSQLVNPSLALVPDVDFELYLVAYT